MRPKRRSRRAYGAKLHETKKFISMSGHFKAWPPLTIRSSYFAKLPKDGQAVLAKEAVKVGDFLTKLTLDSEQDYKDKLRVQGATIVEGVDSESFRKATLDVDKAFLKRTPGLRTKIDAVLGR